MTTKNVLAYTKNMNKNEILRHAAKDFAAKAQKLSSVLEIAIVGSVAGNDPYPNDLDLAVIVSNCEEIATIAKYARQMSRHYHGWEVFVFDQHLKHLGRICVRKKCPGQSIDCCVFGCGQPPHLRVIAGFNYNEHKFLNSPIDIIWISFNVSYFLARKSELGIVDSHKYPVLKGIEIKCILCGKTFVFTVQEQKWFQKQGFSQPKRCPECRERMWLEGLRF